MVLRSPVSVASTASSRTFFLTVLRALVSVFVHRLRSRVYVDGYYARRGHSLLSLALVPPPSRRPSSQSSSSSTIPPSSFLLPPSSLTPPPASSSAFPPKPRQAQHPPALEMTHRHLPRAWVHERREHRARPEAETIQNVIDVRPLKLQNKLAPFCLLRGRQRLVVRTSAIALKRARCANSENGLNKL
ncbi:hypothetical protein C8F04DRAFT_1264088 [Mycena alexandri]|uniref:Uncharacterized protein n=1 Tax=Mycena alexandri TaxID=1745969 RepID=A0AAD6SM11_9AGAR|nr:hypothetical protein C8F04DRAFT_1264088 [Mycena alexandri]